jgi:hypothetical protein
VFLNITEGYEISCFLIALLYQSLDTVQVPKFVTVRVQNFVTARVRYPNLFHKSIWKYVPFLSPKQGINIENLRLEETSSPVEGIKANFVTCQLQKLLIIY